MYNKYEKKAKQTGARIVHHCGFDSIPSDIGTMLAAKAFREKFGKDAEKVEMVISLNGGGVQGGTVATVLDQMENGAAYHKALKDSMINAPPIPSLGRTKLVYSKGISWSAPLKKWGVPFFMAGCNQPVVRRSNGRLGYAMNMIYNERMGFNSFLRALTFYLGLVALGSILAFPPTRWMFKRLGLLPAPGQGPELDKMLTCSYNANFTASGGGNNTHTMKLSAIGDPGSYSTSYCLGESAVCLSKDAKEGKLSSSGGVMTPAAAMGDALALRLARSGKFAFDFEGAAHAASKM